MAEYVLNVQDIDETGKTYVFAVRREWLVHVLEGTRIGADPTAPEGRVEVHAHKQGADVVLHGRVAAGLVAECARCLEDAHLAVDTEISSLLTARGATLRPEADEVELTPEELDREFFSGDRIVLDDLVREHLLLEVPIQPLCSEECPGIPVPAAVAGPADLRQVGQGVDPRFAPLLALAQARPELGAGASAQREPGGEAPPNEPKLVGKNEPTEE